ncbi:MAG: response regulator [Rhodoferax sp.]|nr:response regulator [Rhodoferax sp.]
MSSIAVEKSFCTTREAATQLGVSVGTVQLWVESGLLQAWKTAGGHRRVLRDSVEGLLHKRPAQPVPSDPAVQTPSGPRRMRILVVEDDPDLLRLYQAQISCWPMPTDLTLVDNAISALLHMGRGGPDLLISDLQMTGMDGFGMLKVLHKAPEMAYTKVVVVTGLDAAEVDARGGVPPGVEVLAKPIPFARLLSIAQAVRQRIPL